MRFALKRVYYMPKELEPNTLYVSSEFDIAMHLCACNCGTVVKTPLGTTEWSVRETAKGPTLRPSVGNWQQQCQSHYFITDGEIEWYEKWSEDEIAAGRRNEQERREAYYGALHKNRPVWARLWNWLLDFLGF